MRRNENKNENTQEHTNEQGEEQRKRRNRQQQMYGAGKISDLYTSFLDGFQRLTVQIQLITLIF